MTDDRRRALDDYDQMADLYADDADLDPMKVSYDRPTIIAMAGEIVGTRVLDIGCATGALSEAVVERGASVVGVDLNPRLVERASERRQNGPTSMSPTWWTRCRFLVGVVRCRGGIASAPLSPRLGTTAP